MVAMGLFMLLGTECFYRKAPVTLAFVLLYMFVVMVWPFEPSRFVLPLWPLWPMFVLAGAYRLWQWRSVPLQRGMVRAAVAGVSVFVIAGYLVYNVEGFRNKWWASAQRDAGKRAKPIVEWALRYTQPHEVLSTEDDLIVYLYGNRKAVPTATFTAAQRIRYLTDEEDLAYARQIFDAYDPGYYIVGSKQGARTANTLARKDSSGFRYLGRTTDVLIFQRQQPGTTR
jgi:hypothetical protein